MKAKDLIAEIQNLPAESEVMGIDKNGDIKDVYLKVIKEGDSWCTPEGTSAILSIG